MQARGWRGFPVAIQTQYRPRRGKVETKFVGMISAGLRHVSCRLSRTDPGAASGVFKFLVRRRESGPFISAANSLARVHRSHAVKSEQNQPTIEQVGLPKRTSQHSAAFEHPGGSCADSLFIILIISDGHFAILNDGIPYPPITSSNKKVVKKSIYVLNCVSSSIPSPMNRPYFLQSRHRGPPTKEYQA